VLGQLLTIFAVLLVAILAYRYHRPVLAALKRFDDANRARIEGEIRDRTDSLAHFRHTLKIAEEQVEEIGEITVPDERTGQPVTRYVFEGEVYADRREALRAREEKVRVKARAFYMELPAALAARKGNGKLGHE
jgi:hypothetical protein